MLFREGVIALGGATGFVFLVTFVLAVVAAAARVLAFGLPRPLVALPFPF